MVKEIELVLYPQEVDDTSAIKRNAAEVLKLSQEEINHIEILKRSIDARGKNVVYRFKARVYINEVFKPDVFSVTYQDVTKKNPVLIIGAGPAGLFAALRCIELGLKPVIIERGKDIKQRRRDLAIINKLGIVNPDSNYCFGEGGAGTYSDGKLYTRSDKRGDVFRVLKMFVLFGASPDILIDARPHIGTNKLPQIIQSIRESIISFGGEVYFNSKVNDIIVSNNQVKGVKLSNGNKLFGEHVILATGHSARDIPFMLHKHNILIQPKPFALGVRIEHPQNTIDKAQYHTNNQDRILPPSYYSLVEQIDGRGVFSFCMCPGGIIAPCSTEQNEIVVNGWSPSKRNNPFANSGIVVQVSLEDVPGLNSDAFKMLNFQSEIEKLACKFGGGNLVAPAQRMVDFVNDKVSSDLPVNSYLPGVKSADLSLILPSFIHQRLKKALPLFGKKMKGYFTNQAVLLGIESRTSSPIRIPRDKETFQHPQLKGLYPCGEGAGYAGGIISAAIDGINCVNAIYKTNTE